MVSYSINIIFYHAASSSPVSTSINDYTYTLPLTPSLSPCVLVLGTLPYVAMIIVLIDDLKPIHPPNPVLHFSSVMQWILLMCSGTSTSTKHKYKVQSTSTKYKYKVQVQRTSTKYQVPFQSSSHHGYLDIRVSRTPAWSLIVLNSSPQSPLISHHSSSIDTIHGLTIFHSSEIWGDKERPFPELAGLRGTGGRLKPGDGRECSQVLTSNELVESRCPPWSFDSNRSPFTWAVLYIPTKHRDSCIIQACALRYLMSRP